MGLDMFLTAKKFVSKFPKEKNLPEKARQALNLVDIECPLPVSYIQVEVAYWRKANAIHKWFVDNVQDGIDNCESYYVSRDALEKLRKDVSKALKHAEAGRVVEARSVFTPTAGFCFGPTNSGKCYIKDLKYTLAQLDVALSLPEDWSLEYSSSW